MITYDNLWKTMKEKGITQHHDFSQCMFRRMKNNLQSSTYTLGRLCSVLNCRIEDIITFVPKDEVKL